MSTQSSLICVRNQRSHHLKLQSNAYFAHYHRSLLRSKGCWFFCLLQKCIALVACNTQHFWHIQTQTQWYWLLRCAIFRFAHRFFKNQCMCEFLLSFVLSWNARQEANAISNAFVLCYVQHLYWMSMQSFWRNQNAHVASMRPTKRSKAETERKLILSIFSLSFKVNKKKFINRREKRTTKKRNSHWLWCNVREKKKRRAFRFNFDIGKISVEYASGLKLLSIPHFTHHWL